MALFTLQARGVLAALRPDVSLVLSGWGGDDWHRCTDQLPGLDAVLPGDVVFSALDNVVATPTVSEAYGAVSPARERWPVVWFEYDGDQWFPQPNLEAMAGACRDAVSKGCQGLLGIHWRTRAVEESAAYCAQFAWNPDLTVEDFCGRRGVDLFGEKAGKTLSPYLTRLQALGYRWVGGLGQTEGGRFSWNEGAEAERGELETIARELHAELTESEFWPAELLADLPLFDIPLFDLPVLPDRVISDLSKLNPLQRPTFRPGARGPITDLVRQIHYVAGFDRAGMEFVPDGPFDSCLYDEDLAGAATLIKKSGLIEALHTYARRIKNKGELGVLATINTKAWADLRSRAEFDEDTLATLTAFPEGMKDRPELLMLPDRLIVAGAKQASLSCTVKARPLGKKRFSSVTLEPMGGGSFALAFPDEVASERNLEYGIEIKVDGRTVLTSPKEFPTQLHVTTLPADFEPRLPSAGQGQAVRPPAPRYEVSPERYAVQLTWDAVPGESYTVLRDGKRLAAVSDGWFEDNQPRSGSDVRYTVVARNVATGETARADVSVPVPDLPLPTPPEEVRLDTRANRIVLGWEDNNPAASQYYILKYNTEHQIIEETYIDSDYGHYLQMSDHVEGGVPYTYTVAAVAPDGRIGPASKPMGIISSTQALEPLVYLSFEDESHLAGLAQLANNALALGGRGWAELPPQPEWDPDHALSIALWVKLDDLDGMPVLVCKGTWQQSGYFLQLYNKQIRFYLAGVDTLDAGRVTPGEWQHVVATFGFNQMRLYVNGEQVGRKRVQGRPQSSSQSLLIGRYEVSDDVYFVRGLMDDIRIYLVPLTPDEVRDLYTQTKR